MKIVTTLGDYYHNEARLKETLSMVLSEISDVNIIYTTKKGLIDQLDNEPDLVILGSENRLNPDADYPDRWMSKTHESKIVDYVKKGGSWFAWHSGLASYESNTTYIDMVGGYFTHHPEKHVVVHYEYIEDRKLSSGKKSFEIVDEHYFVDYTQDISVFLNSTSEHGDSIAGWTKRYGQGKVSAYTPAHNKEGLMDDSVQTDLRDIITWLIKG